MWESFGERTLHNLLHYLEHNGGLLDALRVGKELESVETIFYQVKIE